MDQFTDIQLADFLQSLTVSQLKKIIRDSKQLKKADVEEANFEELFNYLFDRNINISDLLNNYLAIRAEQEKKNKLLEGLKPIQLKQIIKNSNLYLPANYESKSKKSLISLIIKKNIDITEPEIPKVNKSDLVKLKNVLVQYMKRGITKNQIIGIINKINI